MTQKPAHKTDMLALYVLLWQYGNMEIEVLVPHSNFNENIPLKIEVLCFRFSQLHNNQIVKFMYVWCHFLLVPSSKRVEDLVYA